MIKPEEYRGVFAPVNWCVGCNRKPIDCNTCKYGWVRYVRKSVRNNHNDLHHFSESGILHSELNDVIPEICSTT